jgi:hypothetical protein
MYGFQGVELIGVTAGEAENPEAVLRRTTNSIIYRILIFYIGALVVIMSLVPWNPSNQQGDLEPSPASEARPVLPLSSSFGRYFARERWVSFHTGRREQSHDGFVLWTRLAPMPLTWDVPTDDAMRNVVRTGIAEADSRFAHSVHVEVDSLQPGRPYWYRFTALGQQSPIGRTKTAPAPSARPQRMRFAFASCSNWELGYFSAYRHMAEENPDLMIFLGNYIYEQTYTGALADRIVRKHNGPTASDLAGYRNRYALYRTDADLQALDGAAPCLMTWDDHEVENDYANAWSERMETNQPMAAVIRPHASKHWPRYGALLVSRSRPRLTQCIVRPCVARRFSTSWWRTVLHQCIRAWIGASRSGPSWISARVRAH